MFTFWEIWGIEKGANPPPVRLFTFSGRSGGIEAALKTKQELLDSGAVEVHIVQVFDDRSATDDLPYVPG